MHSPLQNRVDPFGEIHAVPTRGTLMGNRGGCLHDHRRQLGRRRWVSRHWIACELAFHGRHRTVMTPGRYTELFFLDEATALAAGHRPCFACRWPDARAFAIAWACAFALSPPPRADAMDGRLHAERLGSTRASVSFPRVHPAELPNGAMVTFPTAESDRSAWLVQDGKLWRWSFAGYSLALPVAAVQEAELLTAPAIVATLAAGYRPRIHASARDGCMDHPLHVSVSRCVAGTHTGAARGAPGAPPASAVDRPCPSQCKRCRSAKDRSRLWKVGVRDLGREICCAFHHVGLSRVPGWPAPRHFSETCQSSEQQKWTEVPQWRARKWGRPTGASA